MSRLRLFCLLVWRGEARRGGARRGGVGVAVRGEADVARMTEELIERTVAIGGTYYLPYRLHATDSQFRRGYNRAEEFASRKRAIDPDLVFRNFLWVRYLAKI